MTRRFSSSSIELISEGSGEFADVDPRLASSDAARTVAEALRTTLGPKGMDKMLVDASGDVKVTNDGVTILDEMEIVHPAAQVVADVAKSLEDEVGDGTTTAVVLAGAFVDAASDLVLEGFHPTTVIGGYTKASTKLEERLDELATDVTIADDGRLQQVATTCLTGRATDAEPEHLAKLVVGAVRQVVSDGTIDLAKINVKSQTGRVTKRSELFEGTAFRKSPVDESMPKNLEHARILLLDDPITVESPHPDRKIQYQLETPDDHRQLVETEEAQVNEKVQKVLAANPDVVFCRKDIDDRAARRFAKADILAVERVLQSDIRHLTDVLGAPVAQNVDDITALDVGHGSVRRDDGMFLVSGGSLQSVSLILRGANRNTLNEYERSVNDAINAVAMAVTDGQVVAGGGAVEAELARALREYADGVSNREQIAIRAFADALEVVPRVVARNAGFDAIDVQVALRAAHAAGNQHAGFDVSTGELVDMLESGVVDPVVTKRRALQNAVEVTALLLRIDDLLAADGSPDADDVPSDMMANGNPDVEGEDASPQV